MATPKTPGRRASKATGAKGPNDAGRATPPAAEAPPPPPEATPETVIDHVAHPDGEAPHDSAAAGSETADATGPGEPAADADADRPEEGLSTEAMQSEASPLPDLPPPNSPTPETAQDPAPDRNGTKGGEAGPVVPDDTDKRAEPLRATTPLPPPSQARSGGSGFFALLLGGVAAAALGFVMARYVLPEGWPVPGASPLQAQIERQATEIEALRGQLASLNTAPDLSPVEAEIAALRSDLGQVREAAEAARHAAATAANTPAEVPQEVLARLDRMTERLDALDARPARPEGVAAAEDLAGLEAAIATLRAGLAAQEARTAEAAEAARAEIARMQAEAEAAREATEAEAGGTLQQAALARIEAALLNGAAYDDALTLLAGAGHDIAPVLADNAESGLPTLAGLVERFDDPARVAIAAELRSDMGETLGDRIGSFLRAQTGARSLSPREGADADAVLSRAEAALRAGDPDRALAELAALSDPARAEMAGWIVQAERHRDAAAALAALAAAVTER